MTIELQPGVSGSSTRAVVNRLQSLGRHIGHDFDTYPSHLALELSASHRAYSRALWTQQRQKPQADTDDSSSIVHDTLLLGPLPRAYLWHNLAHIYTEWIVDHVTGSRSAAMPPVEPWLYDGLAEYEAHRYTPRDLACSGSSTSLLDVTAIRTGRQWLRIRAGPLGSLEYCLAYLQVHALVAHAGWPCVLRALHDPGGWPAAANHLRNIESARGCVR